MKRYRTDGVRNSGLDISVVVPIYDEEDSVGPLYERLRVALNGLGRTYEIVFVDDGSRDQSLSRLRTFAEADPHVRVVRFRRNFGQTAALQAGIDESTGDVLVFLDGDLQNDPADIPLLVAKLEEGYDVVSGWRRERHDPWLSRRLPSRIGNWLISRVTGVRLKDYGCTLKAYRREVLENVKLYGEMHRFIPAVASWTGASVAEVPVSHQARPYGRSHYGIARTFRVLLDLLTVKFLGSYSTKPIYVFGVAGLVLWILAFGAGVVTLVELWVLPNAPAHRNPLLLLAVFLAILGAMFIMMGLLAELTIRTYHESQDKRTYAVREVLGRERGDEPLEPPARLTRRSASRT